MARHTQDYTCGSWVCSFTADPSLFLRTDTSLPPFYVLVYMNDLVFATADTEALTLVLHRFGFQYSSPKLTPLSTSHSLSAPPSDESVEPTSPYPELVGCLMYLMTCTRPDLAYPLSRLARYVAPGRHRKVHWDAAKRVLRYLCSTSGMGLVLGGRGPVVLTGHADASWELRWLTYLLTDLGEQPRSPPVLYVDNKAMIALCQEHRLEHRTKHIALRYFLARELQQSGQLRLAYMATRANTSDVFTKALSPAPPLDKFVEPSGSYPELVSCLMYLMTYTRPDLAYPLGLLARYVAPGRHRKVHWDDAKRVLRYLCSTSGIGLVLGGRGPVVLTGHADDSWVDDSAKQRLSQGYTLSLGSGSVSWRSTRLSSVLSSSCEVEIYARAMATQELRWLTYLLTDLGEQPRSHAILYVDNKAMIALCQEHRLEHRTKHIALRYFLARELQQRGQLHLAYVASRANTADIFTKALPPGDHQRFSTVLGLTAFRTRYGSYKFTVMPFGLTNAPSTFELSMNRVFRDLLDRCAIVFSDDILIFSKTREQHLRDLDAVFKRLQKNRLITEGSKCEFFKQELEFLGHVISRDGTKIDPANIKTIQEWKSPTNVMELQGFLGFVNYARRFIPNLAGITGPLTNLLHKDRKFVWGEEAEAAFQELKKFWFPLLCCGSPTHQGRSKSSPTFPILPSELYYSKISGTGCSR
ncbi:unnamed protein product [Closterium sp. NIES-54]